MARFPGGAAPPLTDPMSTRADTPRRALIAAWLVHLYTASGVVFAFLALKATIEDDYRTAFFWLIGQVAVDATDGLLARRARVSERIPWFNGAKLDDIVDYLTYVFVPAVMVWRGLFVTDAWALPVVVAMLVSSAFGFNRDDAKTADHFFTGFPSYWNVVVFYMLVAASPPHVNTVILLALSAMVFVPIRYVYPSRTPVWRVATNVLGALWGAAIVVMLWQYPGVSPRLFTLSLAFPVYYMALSLVLTRRRGPARMLASGEA
jgi:phosphatidylcholine synthase